MTRRSRGATLSARAPTIIVVFIPKELGHGNTFGVPPIVHPDRDDELFENFGQTIDRQDFPFLETGIEEGQEKFHFRLVAGVNKMETKQGVAASRRTNSTSHNVPLHLDGRGKLLTLATQTVLNTRVPNIFTATVTTMSLTMGVGTTSWSALSTAKGSRILGHRGHQTRTGGRRVGGCGWSRRRRRRVRVSNTSKDIRDGVNERRVAVYAGGGGRRSITSHRRRHWWRRRPGCRGRIIRLCVRHGLTQGGTNVTTSQKTQELLMSLLVLFFLGTAIPKHIEYKQRLCCFMPNKFYARRQPTRKLAIRVPEDVRFESSVQTCQPGLNLKPVLRSPRNYPLEFKLTYRRCSKSRTTQLGYLRAEEGCQEFGRTSLVYS